MGHHAHLAPAAAIGAAVLTGLASLGAAGAASASPAAPAAGNTVQVLRLHTVFVSLAVNKAGHGGPGDVTAVVFDLQTPAGAEAGTAYVSCATATASVSLCHGAYVHAGGQIDVQVAVSDTATSYALAVTGGTGSYAGSPARPAASRRARGRPTGRSTSSGQAQADTTPQLVP